MNATLVSICAHGFTAALALVGPFAPLARADVAVPLSKFEQQSGQATVQLPAPDARPEARAEAAFLQALKEGVQITEVGNLRCLFVFNAASAETEKQVTQLFSDADFRVFTSEQRVVDPIQPSRFHQIGAERYADLVIYTQLTSQAKVALGALKAEEATVHLNVYSPMSQEVLVSHSVTKVGQRHPDAAAARVSAITAAVAAAAPEVIAKTLEKAHKVVVHEAQLKGVEDAKHLLEIMNYTARLKGVYHVRQISHDRASGLAIIEIVAAPQTEAFWRAYLQDLPKREKWQLEVKHQKISLRSSRAAVPSAER